MVKNKGGSDPGLGPVRSAPVDRKTELFPLEIPGHSVLKGKGRDLVVS